MPRGRRLTAQNPEPAVFNATAYVWPALQEVAECIGGRSKSVGVRRMPSVLSGTEQDRNGRRAVSVARCPQDRPATADAWSRRSTGGIERPRSAWQFGGGPLGLGAAPAVTEAPAEAEEAMEEHAEAEEPREEPAEAAAETAEGSEAEERAPTTAVGVVDKEREASLRQLTLCRMALAGKDAATQPTEDEAAEATGAERRQAFARAATERRQREAAERRRVEEEAAAAATSDKACTAEEDCGADIDVMGVPPAEAPVRPPSTRRSMASRRSSTGSRGIEPQFVEWLEERPAMFRLGSAAGLGWEFPLSRAEKAELVMLNLAGENLGQRQALDQLQECVETQREVIEFLQDKRRSIASSSGPSP